MKKYVDGLYSFVYKYQMAICAVWYTTDSEASKYLEDKLANVSDINLKSRLKPRTAEELSQDRAEIIAEVKSQLGSQHTVRFGDIYD